MSALPPKADMCGATRDVRFEPKADIGRRGYFTCCTGGIAQVPSIAALRGEYSRAWREKGWAGVGSQFDSLSAPGFSLWR